MRRKLVKQGNNALTLSLPYKWLEKHNLSKGDYVNVRELGKDLLISTIENIKLEKKTYEINISKKNPFFKRYIKSCYVLGYDEVLITSDDVIPYNLVKESILDLLGYEIIEQTQKRCTVGILSKLDNGKIDVLMKKLFFIIQTMFDDLIELIRERNLNQIKEVAEVESSVDSFVHFCLRVLNKYGHKEFSKTQYYYNILVLIEQIADSLRDYSLSFSKKSLITLGDLILLRDYFINVVKLYLKYNMSEISKIKKMRQDLYNRIRSNCNKEPLQYLDMYSILNNLHQFEVVIDPIKN